MSTRDDMRAKLQNPTAGGWKALVQDRPEALNLLIDILGTEIQNGASATKPVRLLEKFMKREQSIQDMDLLVLLTPRI